MESFNETSENVKMLQFCRERLVHFCEIWMFPVRHLNVLFRHLPLPLPEETRRRSRLEINRSTLPTIVCRDTGYVTTVWSWNKSDYWKIIIVISTGVDCGLCSVKLFLMIRRQDHAFSLCWDRKRKLYFITESVHSDLSSVLVNLTIVSPDLAGQLKLLP